MFTRQDLHGAYKRVFDTPDGRIVLAHLMKTGHVTTPVAHGDSEQQIRNAGAQHLVLSILRFLNKDPNQIAQQVNDNIQNEYDNQNA